MQHDSVQVDFVVNLTYPLNTCGCSINHRDLHCGDNVGDGVLKIFKQLIIHIITIFF